MKLKLHAFIHDDNQNRCIYEEFTGIPKVIEFLAMLRDSGCRIIHFVIMEDL